MDDDYDFYVGKLLWQCYAECFPSDSNEIRELFVAKALAKQRNLSMWKAKKVANRVKWHYVLKLDEKL